MNLAVLAERALSAVVEPFTWLASPGERVFVGSLAVAFVLGVGVWVLKLRGRISLTRFLLSPTVWLHRSALLDYRFIVARSLVDALLFAPAVISSTAVAMLTLAGLSRTIGRGPFEGQSAVLVVAALTVATFLADDLVRYFAHRLLHRVPALWDFHQVHHSAEVLTPFTVHRTHPVEGLIMRLSSSIGIGVAAGAVSWLFVKGASPLTVVGVHALSFAWAALGANLRHSHVWISFGPVVERVLSSPAQHQVHHSKDPRHHDKNFASALALWDWMFGTLYVTGARERLTFGLDDEIVNHRQTVGSMLVGPFVAIARRTRAKAMTLLAFRRTEPARARALRAPTTERPPCTRPLVS